MSTDTPQPGESQAWKKLADHAKSLKLSPLAELLNDPARYENCSLEFAGLAVDFSRCQLSAETIELLEKLADECHLTEKISQLADGAALNSTEGRSALHTALRGTPTEMQGVKAAVDEQLQAFLAFADGVRDGSITGTTGQRIRKVINIGIGGSDLGPRLVARALAKPDEPLHVAFVAGVDGIELADALTDANPEETLFIFCSKTFTTQETRVNADAARAWLQAECPEATVADHFAAVSVNEPAMDEFGIGADRRFAIWDWVGGRYSVWSAVGLSAAIAIGSEAFRELLKGAREMDEHFLNTPFAENIPLMLGMLGIWNQNLLAKEASVVLPYDQRLEVLPNYLQQLYMESQGKTVQAGGDATQVSTGKALWGATGSHAQHSFAQWLHQGDAHVVVEYVGVVNGPEVQAEQGRLLSLSNMIAQAEALAYGQDENAVRADLAAAGIEAAEIEALLPHKIHPGNRSSVLLMLKQLDARSLGALLALYEHRVFVQSMVWGINPFDQWGVELGKHRASQFAGYLASGNADELPGIAQQILRWSGITKA